MEADVIEFLSESNAIEGVYDGESLDQAVEAWKFLMKQDVMTTGVILKTHKILMLNQKGLYPNEKGYFRNITVYIGGKASINALHVPMLIQKWCFETMRKSPPIDPIALHVEYENIHPFVDGNGRTGRMFLNWTRVKRLGLPVLVIPEAERQEYYKLFKN